MNWSPNDFHLFPHLKQYLGGHKFKDACGVGNRCDTTPGNKASAKNVKFFLRWTDCLSWGCRPRVKVVDGSALKTQTEKEPIVNVFCDRLSYLEKYELGKNYLWSGPICD